jgi:hypothetical protein
MIIKSMSRKAPTFKQLIEYMEKERGHRAIIHNLYCSESAEQKEIIKQFEENAQHLPKRKNGNYLYHEVLTLENKHDLDSKKLSNLLTELGEMYLKERAKNQLAFAYIHTDTKNHHIHFCISANELQSEKRKRLSKAEFSKIQQKLETHILEKYPELNQSEIYNKSLSQEQMKTSTREQAYKKRTGKLSKKEEMKNKLHGIFEQANSIKELNKLLVKNGFKLYQRGQTVGVVNLATNRKHRLKTLGLLPHYEATKSRFTEIEPKQKEKTTEQQRADELNKVYSRKKNRDFER